jgi:hypothetical protein
MFLRPFERLGFAAMSAGAVALTTVASAKPLPVVMDGGGFTAITLPVTVEGAHVNVSAQMERAQGRGRSISGSRRLCDKVSDATRALAVRASYNVILSADKREASLNVNVRGKNEFWNKERGWFDG